MVWYVMITSGVGTCVMLIEKQLINYISIRKRESQLLQLNTETLFHIEFEIFGIPLIKFGFTKVFLSRDTLDLQELNE